MVKRLWEKKLMINDKSMSLYLDCFILIIHFTARCFCKYSESKTQKTRRRALAPYIHTSNPAMAPESRLSPHLRLTLSLGSGAVAASTKSTPVVLHIESNGWVAIDQPRLLVTFTTRHTAMKVGFCHSLMYANSRLLVWRAVSWAGIALWNFCQMLKRSPQIFGALSTFIWWHSISVLDLTLNLDPKNGRLLSFGSHIRY